MRRPFRPGANFGWIFADLAMPQSPERCASHSGIFVVHSEPKRVVSRNVLADAARQSLRILRWQLGWVVAAALVSGWVLGARTGWSVLTGGAIGSVWTVYMALTLFKHSLSHGAQMSAASFVAAWIIKVALTISLLVIAFRSKVFVPPALLGGLFCAMVAYWARVAFGQSQRKS
jgi:F0F1-type ATP synthase assembly protein I